MLLYKDRVELYKKLEKQLKSHVLVYVTGDRPGFETQIAGDTIDLFIEQLDKIGIVKKISLYLYTRGGDTAAAWNIINLLRQYCDELQVIVPHKAHSAGTIISLGANSIIMTKQATLGPIDPSLNTPLNPRMPNIDKTYPVSVEAVKGYIALAKSELRIKDDMALSNVLLKLTEHVHPLVLGNVFRSRAQIKMLAKKLLINQVKSKKRIKKIISFLCSESGSHDYTINRREAKNSLKLNIKKPDDKLYRIIKDIYDDISKELGLREPADIRTIAANNNGNYAVKRVLLESLNGGSEFFLSQGKVEIRQSGNGAATLQDIRLFEGWKHEELSE